MSGMFYIEYIRIFAYLRLENFLAKVLKPKLTVVDRVSEVGGVAATQFNYSIQIDL